jgi:ADP-heptose:LPS heptosyltransferase
MIRRLDDRLRGTAFDRAVAAAAAKPRAGFLFVWNRGLGDVTLALVPLFARIRERVPGARITVVTRAELAEPFRLTDADDVRVIAGLDREAKVDAERLRAGAGLDPERFDAVFLDPDCTRWLHGARDEHPPKLRWDPAWDALAAAVVPDAPGRTLIGAHVSSETAGYYGYVKDWPVERWRELMERLGSADGARWVLFGHRPEPAFDLPHVADLRGRTGFLEMMAIVKNRCRALVGPDSGILNTAYFLGVPFPIDLVSLWSDPRHGILQQGGPSPNPLLRHVPLVGRDEDVRNIAVAAVEGALRRALQR